MSLVIFEQNFNTKFFQKPCIYVKLKLSRHTKGQEPVSPNDTWGRGPKIGQKSVTYYLNGP